MIRLGSIGARPSCRGLRLSWVRIAYTTLFLLVFTFSSKAGEWIHDRQSGCAVWNPAPQPGETIEWSGACADERASGYGILTWMRNGIGTETAKGNFAAGKLEGTGSWQWASGHRYQGNFSNGEFDGEGVFTWPDGASYSGDFLKNQRHGLGRHQSPNGARYEGPYRGGERHGEGRCYLPGEGWSSCRWFDGERIDGLTEV